MQWGIDPVAALGAAPLNLSAPDATQVGVTGSASGPGAFATLMQRGLGELNGNVGAAEKAMSDLATGKSVELHDVMISLERAQISVQTFVQVRNKLIESYQDLMRMQL